MYYAIRAQALNVTKALREQRQKDAALEIVFDVQPNTKTLYNRIKEDLVERGVVFLGNYISLTDAVDFSETEFVERMREVNYDKYDVVT